MGEKIDVMTNTLRIILIVFTIIYFLVVIFFLKRGRLALKYSLLWLLMGCIMAILVIFPRVLGTLSTLFGIMDTMNGLFTFALGFVLMLLMSLTAIVSKQNERIRNLAQENALMEKRIRDLENNKLINKDVKFDRGNSHVENS